MTKNFKFYLILVLLTVLTIQKQVLDSKQFKNADQSSELSQINQISIPENSFMKIKDYQRQIPNAVCLWNSVHLIQLKDSSIHTLNPLFYIKVDRSSFLAVPTCCGPMVLDQTKKRCTACQNYGQCSDTKRFQCIDGLCVKRCDQHSRIIGDKCGSGINIISDVHDMIQLPNQLQNDVLNFVELDAQQSSKKIKAIIYNPDNQLVADAKHSNINQQNQKSSSQLNQIQQLKEDSFIILIIVLVSLVGIAIIIISGIICIKRMKNNNMPKDKMVVSIQTCKTINQNQLMSNSCQIMKTNIPAFQTFTPNDSIN